MLRKFQLKISARWREALLILAVLLISGVVQGYNMFGFPYFENDEGTYLSQAWSLLNQGQLSPYTYWYDHPPLGWMLVAAWRFITSPLLPPLPLAVLAHLDPLPVVLLVLGGDVVTPLAVLAS